MLRMLTELLVAGVYGDAPLLGAALKDLIQQEAGTQAAQSDATVTVVTIVSGFVKYASEDVLGIAPQWRHDVETELTNMRKRKGGGGEGGGGERGEGEEEGEKAVEGADATGDVTGDVTEDAKEEGGVGEGKEEKKEEEEEKEGGEQEEEEEDAGANDDILIELAALMEGWAEIEIISSAEREQFMQVLTTFYQVWDVTALSDEVIASFGDVAVLSRDVAVLFEDVTAHSGDLTA